MAYIVNRTWYIIIILLLCWQDLPAQTPDTALWHNKERVLRYHPEGTDFVISNGKRRFVRALYGTNTAFRVEAGDLPEFALYMPGMGGNFKFGIIAGDKSKWIIDAASIKAVYRPGSMLYEIKDPIMGNGSMYITILALAEGEGMIIQTNFKNVTGNTELVWAFGGASGKKFSRDGDIGADPESSFYLQPGNCKDNIYTIDKNSFQLEYGSGRVLTEEERYEIQQSPQADKPIAAGDTKNQKQLTGLFPVSSVLKLADASKQKNPAELYNATVSSAPVIAGKMKIENAESYFLIQNVSATVTKDYTVVKTIFNSAEAARKKIAERVIVNTPDTYINTIGGALAIAADAIWEAPSYLHGAVAWRMRLNAWRGPYVADPLGWHDRAREHFSSYALSQITTPAVAAVVMDTALHLARHLEKIGTALFSDGYICRNPGGDIRAHHYDMNLVFVDELLNHFNWTGDTNYVRQMWPLIKRHLAWEKRNFDADGDGLYDAYAAIWASDALQYSGGGVTHSSAYNYRANKTAAELAKLIGEDGTPYKNEADKIYAAVQKNLWLPYQGSYAEYKDLLGNKLVHPSPGLWTIYHAIDSKLPDDFQAYECLRYIDNYIPHIPVKAKGLNEKGLYLLSTTNWQPYTWSLNNVALAENLHTALAYWQGNRSEEAYRLWRSAIIESMYMSASPGGFEQLSFYDAIRGELYRDFADPIGMAGRSLVEGLFGIEPDALHDTLTIHPGFPSQWNYATLQTPDAYFDFKRTGNTDNYLIKQFFRKELELKLIVNAPKDDIAMVRVNGDKVKWEIISSSVGKPELIINMPAGDEYKITIQWRGNVIIAPEQEYEIKYGRHFQLTLPGIEMLYVYDPEEAIDSIKLEKNKLTGKPGNRFLRNTIFIRVRQGSFTWWQPVCLSVMPSLNPGIPFFKTTYRVGENIPPEKLELSKYFNDKVTNIFKHQYLSPRPTSPTLQLPTQGIGNWCYPLTTATIDDKGLRQSAGTKNEIVTPNSISFATPSDTTLNNIIFTSQWDNFPHSVSIPLSGKASQIHLLMAGSTNPMQSRITNGMVVVSYTDGSGDTLLLENPGNWWPIEQDYYIDHYAFTSSWQDPPERLYLKDGKFAKGLSSYSSIKGFTNMAIDGGAATLLDMYLDKKKTLQSLSVHAIANDVVIGLMAATLIR
ncbi:MAG: DUF4450 domain-containing protein [Bacteroidota bacterium]|nr:DUF4450 domain-containing protein [Bacteroidota bacterium]